MTRPILLAVLATLALPGAALAAPVKISPHPSAVSARGAATVEVANPNRYALRGTAAVAAGTRTVLRRDVRLARRSVTPVPLRFGPRAIAALLVAGGRATLELRLRRPGGQRTAAHRAFTLRLPAVGAPTPAPPAGGPAPGGAPGSPGDGGSTPPPTGRWTGRMGTEGAYDDFELTAVDGRLQFTGTPFVPVSCFEMGGSYRSSLSFELFAVVGPWTIGTDGLVAEQGIAVNQLVSSGARTINYKVTGTSQQAGRLDGTLGMSFSDSRYDVFSNTITFINCAGSQSFEAVPAG
jgi:hypothetical protein